MPNQRLLTLLQPSPFKVGVLVVMLSCLLFYSFGNKKPMLLEALDNRILDNMFHLRGPIETTEAIVIVDIDEKSLRKIGQWPWPRNIVADLVKKIHEAGAKVIGFDIVFAEEDRTSPQRFIDELSGYLPDRITPDDIQAMKENDAMNYDLILGDTIAQTPVVLGYIFQTVDDGLKRAVDTPFPSCNIRIEPDHIPPGELALIPSYRAIINILDISQAETEGFFNVFPDPSGTVRKVPLLMELDGVPYPSLALEMLRMGLGAEGVTIHASSQATGGKNGILGITLAGRFIPTDDNGQVAVNFRGPQKTFPYVSAHDVLQGKDLSRLDGKIILIGTSAAGLLDLRAIPYSNVFPGVEVHANVIDNILANDPFTHDVFTEIGLTYTLIILGGLLMAFLLAYSSPLIGGFGGILLVFLYLSYGNYHLFFLKNQIIGITYPLMAIVTVFIFVTLFNYFFEGREKRFIHGAFGHYVSPDVVNQLMQNPDKLSLAGEQKNVTIFFNDIRGFTSISEKMNSEELGIFMNEYLTAMSTLIMEHKGTVDKYIGDAIMAIWGAPLDDDDHAANAIRASLAMMEKLEEIRPTWEDRGLPYIDIGIGLNTGTVSVGNFGSEQRFDYTVLGDNVNLASRLEGSNKTYGTNIIISEFTKAAINDRFFCRFIDMVRMKGKEQPVTIYEPLIEGKPDEILKEEVETFERAIALYKEKEFHQAEAILEELQSSRPRKLYTLYLERIEAFSKKPPPENWDGVFTFTTK